MKFHTIIVSWMVLTAGLVIWTGSAAAADLPDLISMAAELGSRWGILEKEIVALVDLPATQKSLARMAKEMNKLSRDLKEIGRAHV